MTRRAGLLLLLALAGFFLYLWPAFTAPVVIWSDSEIDLKWAREGVGLWKPLTEEEARRVAVHPLKPGYILYLRLASRAIAKVGEPRSTVIVQSALLWFSIAATSFVLGRRRGTGAGIALYAALILYLPLRNSASAVMSEAISAALLLPLVAAAAIARPRMAKGIGGLALGLALLVSIRPNVGAIGFLLVAALYVIRLDFRNGLILAAFFSVFVLAGWLLQRPLAGGRAAPGAADILVFGSTEYYWRPAIGDWPKASEKGFFDDPRTRRAFENWRKTIARAGPDIRREIVWRALHGLFGQDFYDARWSETYRSINAAARIAAPFLLLAVIAVLLASSRHAALWASLTLLTLLVLHNALFGSSPRLLLPFLPILPLLAAVAISSGSREGRLPLRIGALFVVLAALLATGARQATSWDWGAIEAGGATVRQRIRARALPANGPATLHLRVAPTDPRSTAHFVVRAQGREIYRSFDDPTRHRPIVTIQIPPWLQEANARRSVELEVVSTGTYSSFSYVVFAVIPPPFGRGARRTEGDMLSPLTGIRSGSLDWWAHPGTD